MHTLETLHTATKQQVFDQIFKHLYKQGRTAHDVNGGNCVYRNENGDKCAAGCLISDEYYDASIVGNSLGDNGYAYFENNFFTFVAEEFNDKNPAIAIPKEIINLICNTQDAHDRITDLELQASSHNAMLRFANLPEEPFGFHALLIEKFGAIASLHELQFEPTALIAEIQ